jgi:hypothetical protein
MCVSARLLARAGEDARRRAGVLRSAVLATALAGQLDQPLSSAASGLRDESLEDMDNFPAPEIIAREIVEDLTAALAEFEAVVAALDAASGEDRTD